MEPPTKEDALLRSFSSRVRDLLRWETLVDMVPLDAIFDIGLEGKAEVVLLL